MADSDSDNQNEDKKETFSDRLAEATDEVVAAQRAKLAEDAAAAEEDQDNS